MADIEKIIDGINIPKQLLDKSEALLKTLFGESFTEFGGMIADQVRLRRFKNQIKIFEKAQKHLQDYNINPKKISLKVLAPMIEYSSLEEDESLQDRWAFLITNTINYDNDIVFQQNAISVLNRISSEDAKVLQELYLILDRKRGENFKRQIANFERSKRVYQDYAEKEPPKIENIKLNALRFSLRQTSEELKIPADKIEFILSNLILQGLLKWETSVDVRAEKANDNPDDREIDVDVSVLNSGIFIFTSLGHKFVKVSSGIMKSYC